MAEKERKKLLNEYSDQVLLEILGSFERVRVLLY